MIRLINCCVKRGTFTHINYDEPSLMMSHSYSTFLNISQSNHFFLHQILPNHFIFHSYNIIALKKKFKENLLLCCVLLQTQYQY